MVKGTKMNALSSHTHPLIVGYKTNQSGAGITLENG